MTKLKKEHPAVFKEIALPKIPTDTRSWKIKEYERKGEKR